MGCTICGRTQTAEVPTHLVTPRITVCQDCERIISSDVPPSDYLNAVKAKLHQLHELQLLRECLRLKNSRTKVPPRLDGYEETEMRRAFQQEQRTRYGFAGWWLRRLLAPVTLRRDIDSKVATRRKHADKAHAEGLRDAREANRLLDERIGAMQHEMESLHARMPEIFAAHVQQLPLDVPTDDDETIMLRAYKLGLIVDTPGCLPKLTEVGYAALRRSVMQDDSCSCALCGSEYGLEVHRIVCLGRPGSNAPVNWVTLCETCHQHRATGWDIAHPLPQRQGPEGCLRHFDPSLQYGELATLRAWFDGAQPAVMRPPSSSIDDSTLLHRLMQAEKPEPDACPVEGKHDDPPEKPRETCS